MFLVYYELIDVFFGGVDFIFGFIDGVFVVGILFECFDKDIFFILFVVDRECVFYDVLLFC